MSFRALRNKEFNLQKVVKGLVSAIAPKTICSKSNNKTHIIQKNITFHGKQ